MGNLRIEPMRVALMATQVATYGLPTAPHEPGPSQEALTSIPLAELMRGQPQALVRPLQPGLALNPPGRQE
jgi:hypothetical protein